MPARGDGVYKTENGGGLWAAKNDDLPANTVVFSIALDPLTPTTLYAGTRGDVYKSMNSGDNWKPAEIYSPDTDFVIPGDRPCFPGNHLCRDLTNGIFKSTNGGQDWDGINAGLTWTSVRALAIDPVIPGILYAGTANGVFKSSSGGDSWTVCSGWNTLKLKALAVAPVSARYNVRRDRRGRRICDHPDGKSAPHLSTADLLIR